MTKQRIGDCFRKAVFQMDENSSNHFCRNKRETEARKLMANKPASYGVASSKFWGAQIL